MPEYYVGLMSGTSMDGIDAALVDFNQTPQALVATHNEPLPKTIREALFALTHSGPDEINQLGQLDRQLGELFATATINLLKKAKVPATEVIAIASHGVNVRHQPRLSYPFTLQIADPHTIAQQTGITTVADFRRRDIAYGGHGAPLTPAFHAHAFADPKKAKAVVNIGGIANVTILEDTVLGFDTGPGNTLLDAWIRKHCDKGFDDNGAWSQTGTVQDDFLTLLLNDEYFQTPPPKSTGREYFNLLWLEQYVNQYNKSIASEDMQATLTAFTARTIADAIQQHSNNCQEVLICGGGIHNQALLAELQNYLSPISIVSTEQHGIPPDWLEAIAFAWFAKHTIEKNMIEINMQHAATVTRILGAIYLGTNDLAKVIG